MRLRDNPGAAEQSGDATGRPFLLKRMSRRQWRETRVRAFRVEWIAWKWLCEHYWRPNPIAEWLRPGPDTMPHDKRTDLQRRIIYQNGPKLRCVPDPNAPSGCLFIMPVFEHIEGPTYIK